MKNAFTVFVALHLLAHAFLGCCWHHAHAAHDDSSDSAGHEIANHGSCHHNHPHGHLHWHDVSTDDGERPSNHAPVDSCDDDNCFWLSKDTTEIIRSLGSVGLVSEIDTPSYKAARPVEHSSGAPPPDLSAASPPVPAYLLYQILMI